MSSPLRRVLEPRVLIVAGALAILAAAAHVFHLSAVFKSILEQIKDLGPLAPLIFIAIYVVGAVAFVPGAILTIGGGAIFGLVRGSVYVVTGATLGATAAFLVGRYAARGWVQSQIEGNQNFSAIDRAVGREGWKIVFLTRLSPIFPFNLLNYAFGVTAVSLRAYFFATLFGIVPGTVLYVYIGSLGGELAAAPAGRGAGRWIIDIIGLAATIAVALYTGRLARRALQEKA